MNSRRKPLPVNTKIKLKHGGLYRIAGEPIGYGGCSILYPAHRLIGEEGQELPDGTVYALKECFPAPSRYYSFIRSEDGSIIPDSSDEKSWDYLNLFRKNTMDECRVVRTIFDKSNYILPILESADSITVTLPDQLPRTQTSTVAVMHSLLEKGIPLHELMEENDQLKPAEAFRILQHLLLALQEIHHAGYVHLDINVSNLFLRGALNNGINMLTLMDLGSARPVKKNPETGDITTDVINLQELFVSDGFCPPEARLSSRRLLCSMGIPNYSEKKLNENHIALGVNADLYQAGCLLRYLLTGSRLSTEDLLACYGGSYLHSNLLSRMRCTDTAAEQILHLLSKSLHPNPKARYQSADKMLEDVGRILNILNSKPVDLGSKKYDAFICYKHGPVDSVVARKLQQMLEHYRAPQLDNVPRKPFNRVFVDEGELSSCADMGKEIELALKNSAHLIVLCSEKTPASVWVADEIRTFRKYNKTGKIITVLTGGTPETSYPPELIPKGKAPSSQYSPHVQGRYPWQVIYKLRRGEFLKIVAPMLQNTTFDDLMQRKKVYRRRQAAVALVLLSIISSVFVYRSVLIARQAARIKEEHAVAQRNAALYLTEQSRLLMEDKDRLGALELLLDALPEKDQKYDALPQTEYQLSQVLGVYTTPTQAEGLYTDTGKIRPSYSDFFLDPSGSYLFSWNAAAEIMEIWNTETMALHRTVNVPLATVEQHLQRTLDFSSLLDLLTPSQYACETSEDFLLPEGNTLIYRGRGQVAGLDYVGGTNRWTTPIDYITAMAINESKSHLIVLSETEGDYTALNAHILDTETGQIQRSVPLRIDSDWVVSTGMQISEDLKWAAIPVQEVNPESVYFPHHKLYLLNLETGKNRLLHLPEGQISALRFVGDRLLLQHHDNFSFTMLEPNGVEMSKVPDSKVSLEAYDLASGTLVWHQEQPCYFWDSYDQGILPISYDTGAHSGQGILFYWDRFAILADLEAGMILRSYDLSDGILRMKTQDNNWYAIFCNGTEATGSYDSENLYQNKLVSESLIGADYKNNILYLQQTDGSIVRYEAKHADMNYRFRGILESTDWRLYDLHSGKDADELLWLNNNQVAVLNAESQDILYHNLPSFSPQAVLGLSQDRQSLYWYQDASIVKSLDLSSGLITEYDLPLSDREVSWWNPVCLDSYIVYAAMRFIEGEQNELTIYSWTPGTFKPKVLYHTFLAGELDAIQWDTFLGDPENNACLLAISEVDKFRPTKLLRLDVRSRKAVEIPVNFSSRCA